MPIKTTKSPNIVFAETANGPSDVDFIEAVNVHLVDNILALDGNIYNTLFPRLKTLFKDGKLNKDVKYRLHHIDPNISSVQSARDLFYGIKNIVDNNGKTLIHCKLGQDRTGFAIASYLIRSMGQDPEETINYVEGLTGYGNGISTVAKKRLDSILMEGAPKKGEIIKPGDSTKDGTQEVSSNEVKDLLSADDKPDIHSIMNDYFSDNSAANDIVSKMRDGFSHGQGNLSAGTVDAGPIADNLSYDIFSDPTRDIYPGNEPSYSDGPTINVVASFRVKRAARKKILMKILNLISELVDKEADKNDAFIGGDSEVNPWDGLPGSSVSPAIPDFTSVNDMPHQPKGLGGNGSINNYNGIGVNNFNNPSGAPGAGNAAGPVESTGYVQL